MQWKCRWSLWRYTGISLMAMLASTLMTPSAEAAPVFSGLYVFGDSLSDTGNTEIVAPGGDIPDTDFTYGDDGRFTNGRVWVEYLAKRMGLGAAEPARGGGTNYAHGGAELDNRDGPSTGLLTQYEMYMAGAGAMGADPDALYVVWGGANDLRGAMVPGTDGVALVNTHIASYHQLLSGLIANGAEQLLVPNVPNLGRTPEAIAAGISAETTQLVLLWNGALSAMLDELASQTDATIWRYDTFGLVEGIFASATALGFTNTTEPCSVVIGNVEQGCARPDQYIFWDSLHPTTAGHQLIGEGAYALFSDSTPVPTTAAAWLLLPGLAWLFYRRGAGAGLAVIGGVAGTSSK